MPGNSRSERAAVSETLAEYLASAWASIPEYDCLDTVVAAIARGAVEVGRRTRLAALAGVLGTTGEINVQGEIVQRLDAEGTQIFVEALEDSGRVAALACEELAEAVRFSDDPSHAYLTVFDPVDGSSNIDVAVTIGSIFGIYRRADDAPITPASMLRRGREQTAAVYVIYGSSTMLVVATRESVDGFTLNPESSEFILTHPGIRMPEKCLYYSVNEHYFDRWEAGVQQAVSALREKYGLRYVGSLVADFHRDLLKGGIFLYPGDRQNPAGKLRLSYEANPLAFVAEQAGGAASSGSTRILDILPEQLHQRTPLVVGNAEAVGEVEAAIAAGGG